MDILKTIEFVIAAGLIIWVVGKIGASAKRDELYDYHGQNEEEEEQEIG